jgi:NAD(P)-dependent dehydrogenase (short-subunit alcohol dehydrogenase family)
MEHSRVALVTGASSGIGWYTARALAQRGDSVILVGRDTQRCAAARDRILADVPEAQIDVRLADFASLEQVRQLATGVIAEYPQLDVLVNNAGGFYSTRQRSVDGFELTWATNHLAPFLLTNMLIPLLRSSAPARIITVSSAAHVSTGINFDDLNGERSYSGLRAYAQSKLANILFTYELAHRLADSDVTANALHPGFVATGFGSNNTDLFMKLNAILQRLFAITPEQGAQTNIFLATDPSVAQTTGRYFSNSKATASSKASYDVTSRRRLWAISSTQTGL